MTSLGAMADVQRGLQALEANLPRVLDDAVAICEVPAPTFQERRRAEHVARRMRELGLGAPRIDAMSNVVCELPGAPEQPAVVVLAHIDTVFEPDTPIAVRRDGDRLYGPGIGDNSMAVAAMLWLGHALQGLPGRGTLVLAGNVGEEGLGDLCGAKAVYEQYKGRAQAWVALEGAMSGEAVNLGIPSRRLQIVYRGPGGHSWRDFGRPSAIHALGRLVDQIGQVHVPASPKTTFNVGTIAGGRSVNTIAPDASLLLDMRSEDGAALAALERQVRALVDAVADAAGVKAGVEVVGDRPGGRLEAGHWLAGLVEEAAAAAGARFRWKSASTDGNVPLSHGAPAVTLGVGKGENLHSVDEVLDVSVALQGLKTDYLVLAALLLGRRTLG